MIKSIERAKEEGGSGESGALLYYIVSIGNITEGRGIITQYPEGIVHLSTLSKALETANHFSNVSVTNGGWVRTRYGDVDIVCFADGIVIAREIQWGEGESEAAAALKGFGEILTNHIEAPTQAG